MQIPSCVSFYVLIKGYYLILFKAMQMLPTKYLPPLAAAAVLCCAPLSIAFAQGLDPETGDGLIQVDFFRIGSGGGATDTQLNTTSETRGIWNAFDPNPPALGPVGANAQTYNVLQTGTGTYPVVDFTPGGGSFPVNNPLSSLTFDGAALPGNPDDYSLRARAFLFLPAGDYTIAFGSDDGGEVRLTGVGDDVFPGFSARFNPNGTQPDANTTRFEAPRGFAWTGGQFTLMDDMFLEMDAIMYERAGTDSPFEIALANSLQGSFSTVNFSLLQDGLFAVDGEGGIRVSSVMFQEFAVVPEPGTIFIWSLLGLAAVGFAWRQRLKQRNR